MGRELRHTSAERSRSVNLKRISGRLLPASGALAALLILAALACAQGCALCVTQAAQGRNHFIAALRSGTLVLVFPPLAISRPILYISCRKPNQFHNQSRNP